MAGTIRKIIGSPKALWDFVKKAGPFAITQSQTMSENYAKHQLRLAQVEVSKELALKEIETYSGLKEKLLKEYYKTTEPVDRFRLERDIEDLDKRLRQANIYQKAADYLPPKETETRQLIEGSADTKETVQPHWLDRFNEFAKARNELWREELLAKALAKETSNPGSFSLRTLWFIGTMDEDTFHAFSSLLDVSIIVGGNYLIPIHARWSGQPVPNCALGENLSISQLNYKLGDSGLLAASRSKVGFPQNATVLATYGFYGFSIFTQKEFEIEGIIYSPLGYSVASLYSPRPNSLGEQIFESWLNGLPADQFEITNLADPP